MPSSWRAALPEILIAAHSGRALAAAARASGYAPLVADFFGDIDTREIAADSCVVEGDFARGFEAAPLFAALDRLARGRAPVGVAVGTGFEDRPALLDAIARRWPLIGNDAAAVALVKDPPAFAALCAAAGVPHPATSLAPPPAGADWLVKRAGGSGGTHIEVFAGQATAAGRYFQERMPGVPVSLLLLASGGDAQVLGASRQWTAPRSAILRRKPILHGENGLSPLDGTCRHGGALRPWSGPALRKMHAAALALIPATGLRGLASFDFLVDGARFALLEINPRPGATLDIFAHPQLFSAHVAACAGTLPAIPLHFADAQAAATLYCKNDIAQMPVLDWPDWVRDRSPPGSRLRSGDPLCTIISRASAPDAARRLLDLRSAELRARLNQ